jgi:hypothetical protein
MARLSRSYKRNILEMQRLYRFCIFFAVLTESVGFIRKV